MNNMHDAKKVIEQCNKAKEVLPEMKPFLDSITTTIENLILENGRLSKDYYLQKADLDAMKKSMERLQKRSAMITTWFGQDVVKVMDLAADLATERYKK